MKKTVRIFFVIFLAFISTGCSPIIKAEQPAVFDSVALTGSNSIGQSFSARFDGLNGIEIYLNTPENDQGEIFVTLRENPDSENIGQVTIHLEDITQPGFFHFPFPVQANSNQHGYYLLLRVKGQGSLQIGAAPGNSYLNGALYQDGQPNDHHQMAFQLSYDNSRLLLGLVKEMLMWGWYLLISAFLLIPPGFATLDWVFGSSVQKIGWGTKLTLSVGISLALYPVIVSLTNSLGLNLGALYAWAPSLIGLCLISWRRRRQRINIKTIKIQLDWIDLTLFTMILIIFAARFWIIRTLAVPLWGDSLQHAMITQLILNNNGLFSSWQPYAPYYSLTTHFGFSLISALFAWISGMNGTQATLWMGQIINGLAILTLYPLATKISRGNRWAGISAMMVSGLILSLPAFYVNWGRFAQLTGQAVLPVAIWLLWDTLDRRTLSLLQNWRKLLLAGMGLTGMVLSYYRMPFYYATFVVVILLFWGLPRWRFDWVIWRHNLLRLLIIGIIGILLFIPWGVRLMGGNLANAVEAGISNSAASDWLISHLNVLKGIIDYVPTFSLVAAAIAIIYALLQKNWFVAALPLWFVLLIGYMAGAYIKLPGANMLQGFAILIAVYIPLALLIGWLFGEIISLVEKTKIKWIMTAISILIISVAVVFGWRQRLLLDLPKYQLVTSPDIKAMEWIEQQTPELAIFLVQSFQYRQTAAGSDAGWWMPLIASRENMLPPQYAQFNEVSQPPDYTQHVVEFVALLQENAIYDPKSIQALCDWGITHIYNGQQQGQVGGPVLYSYADLRNSPEFFSLLYHQDRVSIFKLQTQACKQ
ncbi:MAG: hypothetical protein ACK2U1_16370 [Anaerolineales bacterium]